MAFNPIDAISVKERIAFSQNFTVVRPTILDTIFPDRKSQYLKADYMRLMGGANLPDIAFVHAFDTEAEIGQRIGFEKIEVEKLFIKRKINQTESIQEALNNGVPENDALINFVFDDAANLFEGVLARTKLMKAQALCKGQIIVNENNIDNMVIDLHVPADNKISFSAWSDKSADIMGDINTAIKLGEENGHTLNSIVTSKKNIDYMRNNTAIQNAVYGANNAKMLTKQDLANFMMSEYGITIAACDEKYREKTVSGKFITKRYWDEDVVSFYEAEANGSFGAGLWGVTPEELEYRQFLESEQREQYITLSMWATEDPVAKWTKASGVFIPVMQKTSGLVIGTVAGE